MSNSPALNVVQVESTSNGTEVVLEGPVAPLVPRAIAENRARLRALTVAGLDGTAMDTAEQLRQGDLSRVTEMLESKKVSDREHRFVVLVRGN